MTKENAVNEVAKKATEEVTKMKPKELKLIGKAKLAVNKAAFTVSKNAPIILTTAGILGLGATAYYAYKSRDKVKDILDEYEGREKHLESHNALVEKKAEGEELTEGEEQELEYYVEPQLSKAVLARDLAGAVALPISLGLASVTAIGSSYFILNNRFKGVAAALAATSARQKYLRERVANEYGEEKLNELENTQEEEFETVDSKGKEVTRKKVVKSNVSNDPIGGRWFADSVDYTADDHAYNMEYLRSAKTKLENLLFQRGYITFNEVMDTLGFDRSKKAAGLGWNTASGFDMTFQTTKFTGTDDIIPQIFVQWSTPISIYNDVDYNGGRYSI